MRYLPTAAIAASLLGGSIGYFAGDSLPELPTHRGQSPQPVRSLCVAVRGPDGGHDLEW